MKFIQLTGLMMAFMLCFAHSKTHAQTKEVFRIFGTIDKFYPVVFTDSAWDKSETSEIQIGRSGVHYDSSWRGSIIATFRYHTNNWGNGSQFIDADIRQYNTTGVPLDKFVAGWRDATNTSGIKCIIIWLRGNTTYTFTSRFNDNVTVYDGSASRPLPYVEPGGPSHTFKTEIDSYVNISGSTYSGNTYFIGGRNYFSGNIGIGTPTPTAKLEIANAGYWTSNGWGKAIKLGKAQSMEIEAGIRKFGIGATSDTLLCFFATDADTVNLPARINMVMTNSGNIGIGTMTPNAYKLAVEGALGARRIKVTQQANWADFVFQPEYKLPKLQDVETFIQQNGHLPEIPTAKEVKENGVDVGEMNKLLLQKVEELTLYLIQQQKEINALKEQMKKQ